MKRLTVLAILLCASPLFPWSERNFKYDTSLGNLRPNTLYRVVLEEPILKKSSARCDDIRVYDAKGAEIPRVIITHRIDRGETDTYDLEVTEYDSAKGAVTARFRETPEAVNAIELDIADENFRRKCLVYGGDGKAWRFLRQGTIYDYTSEINLRNTTIRFPLSKHRYFKVVIQGNGAGGARSIRLNYGGFSFSVDESGERRLRIDGITGVRSPIDDRIQPYSGRKFRAPALTSGNGETRILLEADLPVDRISLNAVNPYYHRKVLFYGGDDRHAESFLTEGSIFRFPGLEPVERNDTLYCSAETHRYYRFTIIDGDSPPLSFNDITLEWFPRYLFFMTIGPGEYRLCFGNRRAPRPEYDLTAFITEKNWEEKTYTGIIPGPIRERSDFRSIPLDGLKGSIERWVLTAVAVLLVIVLGVWLFRLVKKTGS